MKRMKTVGVLVISAFLLTGCSELFTFNLFNGVDGPSTPTASKYTGTDGLDLLATDLASKAYVKALISNASVITDIETLLTGKISGGIDTDEEQIATILRADLYMKTSGGEQFANDFMIPLIALLGTGVESTLLVSDFLLTYTPTEAKASLAAFTAFMTGLLDANEQYLLLGASITDENSSGAIDQGEGVPTGTNMGDAAQKAIMAFVMRMVVQDVLQACSGAADADAIQQMYYLLTGDTASADDDVETLYVNKFVNYFTSGWYLLGSDTYMGTNQANLVNVVDCAGLSIGI